jgi:crotonobetainyl-CoA:carnitine CoA-transferase CaiB-like acyl-CoA transferase
MHEGSGQLPQLAARGAGATSAQPAGTLPAMLRRQLDRGPAHGPGAALGEHTDAFLAELGYERGRPGARRSV